MESRCTVVEPLGHGGRAFRAEVEKSDGSRRDVAVVRMVPAPITHPRFVRAILAEVRPASKLKHANVVELLDFARTPEHVYYAISEYVDGCDLKTLVSRRHRFGVEDAIHIAVECCNGLEHGHSFDVTHRDVCPRSLLVSSSGDVKVANFGFAMVNMQTVSSDHGIVKGKFSYLSPEAASGFEVGPRADVFAVGIVLWELLAGRRLFLGETDYQTVELVRAARVPPIDSVDGALDEIVHKALARDPNDRYERATDLAEALASYATSLRMSLSVTALTTLVRDLRSELKRAHMVDLDLSVVERVQADVNALTSVLDDGEDRN